VLAKSITTASTNPDCITNRIERSRSSGVLKSPLPISFIPSINPNEPPEDAFGGNGTITARGRPAALVAFALPAGPVAVAANLLPLNLPGNWVAVGFTSSGVLSNNFENFAQVWFRLYGNGDSPILQCDQFQLGPWRFFTFAQRCQQHRQPGFLHSLQMNHQLAHAVVLRLHRRIW